MTLPEPPPPIKPRRWGLWAPFGALALGVLAVSANWFWQVDRLKHGMLGIQSGLDRARWTLAWRQREIAGFPFRLFVTLQDATLGDHAGLTLTAPILKAEASAFAPGVWVMLAPRGGAFSRPEGGAVRVTGEGLRLSLSHSQSHPPTLSAEGFNLTFSTSPADPPFDLAVIREFHFHTKAGPSDQGAVYLSFDGFDRSGHAIHSILDGVFTHASAIALSPRPDLRAWKAAGGQFTARP